MKYIVSIFAISCIFIACTKDSFTTSADARLSTSVDSVKFDTVFTSLGSVTKSFKILNNNNQKLLLSKIKLGGGVSSAFKININGTAITEINNIELAANDSMYVFVTVTVNPTVANLPFIISDSILIEFNGRNTKVQLEAFGQNANFIRNGIVLSNVNFTNVIPYVILGALQVASTGSLTINAGTKIYCHANAPILIDGKLICDGTKMQPIIFTGDRLDLPYSSFPASWPGIYFRATSKDNFLQFTTIKNAYQALVVDAPSTNANPKLILKQCIVDNAFDVGLLLTNTKVVADNCLISNCGSGVYASYGGNYSFTHCTVAGYSNLFILHKKPALFISNVNAANAANPLTALLRNCIIYGDAGFVEKEIEVNKQGNNPFSVTLDHCLYRANVDPANTIFNLCIKNIDPNFDSIDIPKRYFDFHITKNGTAAGINKAIVTALLKDLDDKNRNIEKDKF